MISFGKKIVMMTSLIGVLGMLPAGCGREGGHGKDVVEHSERGRQSCQSEPQGIAPSSNSASANADSENRSRARPDPLLRFDSSIRELYVDLQTNYTLAAAISFSDAISRRIKNEPLASLRGRLFSDYHDAILYVTIPRLALYETATASSDLHVASNDFTVACCLTERAWKLGADPLVDRRLALFELPRISWARNCSRSFKKQRIGQLESLFAEYAERLEKLAEDASGPLRDDFLHCCAAIDSECDKRDSPAGLSERWVAKKNHLDRIANILGHCPVWAEEWLKLNPSPGRPPR